MEVELLKYEKYRKNLKFILMCSGIWPYDDTNSRILQVFLVIFSSFSTLFISFGLLLFCINHASNINVLTKGMGLLVSFLTAFVKVFIMALHRKDLQSLRDVISTSFHRDITVPEKRPHLLAHFRTVSMFFYSFHYFFIVNGILCALVPLSMIRHDKYPRMYPQVILFTYEPGGLIHWALYVFELFATFFLWSASCGVDSLFGYYSFHIIGELQLLAQRFRNLKSSKEYAKDLKDCVEQHVDLIKAKHLLERTFGFVTVWIVVFCAVIVCVLIFQGTEMTHLSILTISYLICYSFLKLLQAFAYAWYGHMMNFESKLCLDSIYNAHWPGSGDSRFMKDVFVILLQKPISFKAKSVMALEMQTFQKIINTSFSYFFLLQTLQENLVD